MECHCYNKGLVRFDCTRVAGGSAYRYATQISGLTPDQLTTKYLEGVASAIHMGNVKEVKLTQVEGIWSLALYAVEGSCATQIADYLFQTD
jgi:hypothetical protein